MFYVNNEQVLGIFLNGNNYNYLAYGFGKIIPEDRNSVQLNLNLAGKYLNKYRIEFGTVKDGYENALVSPRLDEPDSNGVFHSPFTYYHNGNIVPTKEVDILITNGNYALRNALVYNDMNINGAVNYFATNTDFQGHNVNVFPEKEDYGQYQALLNYEMLNNCSNFDLNIETRFSKSDYPTLYNCNNFSGNFRYVGNSDVKYPGFRGFLEDCKDGMFNIDCTNMHGGGSSANVLNFYNFSGIQGCSNIRLNITGSSWQAWVHPYCSSSNCNINTHFIVPGFDRMDHCNFKFYIPGKADVEKSAFYSILSNSYNCNVYLEGTNSNLYSFRNGNWNLFLFENLNNCNLNLLLNNSTDSTIDLVTDSTKVNINVNASLTNNFSLLRNSSYINGNAILGKTTWVSNSNSLILNLYNGNNCAFHNVSNSKFGLYNTTFRCYNTNNTKIQSDGGNVGILGADNCYNLTLSGLTFQTPDSDSLFENIYNSDLKFGTSYPYYRLWHVDNCKIDGFPRDFAYVKNCVFRPFNIKQVGLRNSKIGTWNNMWPHRKLAGIRTMDNIGNCRVDASSWVNNGGITFNNVNNMQTSVGAYYNGTVTANLPDYNMNIKLDVDCHNLNLGVFQSSPPHGLGYSSISADNIFCNTGTSNSVEINYGTRIYCENFCNVSFSPVWRRFSDSYQPVLLINNYKHANASACNFSGGIYRIGRLNYRGGMPPNIYLNNGACMFINNVTLWEVEVNNALLFVGSNVTTIEQPNVTNGGLIVSRKNYSMNAIGKFVNRKNFAWNFTDSGPWGSMSLLNFCINV